jgi:uroporphyrinogen III methyltransferase/synthase
MTEKSNQKSSGMYGQVYLVGAGLGNIAYLTRRAEELVKQAEVIIYDALVDEQILQLAPANCQLFYVGKRGGQPSWLQTEINGLLVSECQAGKQVVRLKGGDPFIFGRCTAEIMALQEAGCWFEVVPGISAALAAPELAAIPLTDPVLSRSFTVLSGHEPADLNWEIFSQLETLVILMGTQQLPEIIHQLLRHDRSPKTPIAIIQAGGTAKQTVWTGTLEDILETTRGLSLSPAVIVIGEVVRLRDYLCPPDRPGFLNKPE